MIGGDMITYTKKRKILLIIAVCAIVFSVVVFYLYQGINNMNCVVQNYSYENISTTSPSWVLYDFGLSDNVMCDAIENPQNYYMITFSTELYNRHLYSLYNLEYSLTNKLPDDILFWFETNESKEDYKFESFSSDVESVRLLVKGDKKSVEKLCEAIFAEQSMVCKGDIFPEEENLSEGIYFGNHYFVLDD